MMLMGPDVSLNRAACALLLLAAACLEASFVPLTELMFSRICHLQEPLGTPDFSTPTNAFL